MGIDTGLTRKQFLIAALSGGALSALPASARSAALEFQEKALQTPGEVTLADVEAMERAIGFSLTETERRAALAAIKDFKVGYENVRATKFDNSVQPPIPFQPIGKQPANGYKNDVRASKPTSKLAKNEEDIAFSPVTDLAHWIKTKQISPVELTEIYLQRLEKYGPKLLNVITLTRERAVQEAKEAENEMANGRYRGPLHGIPYVVKDLFAAKGYPTTWGAEPFVDQVFDYDSAVVEKLHRSGAVLCAKASLGALAMNDHWQKGQTKNPWNPTQGSSGSSAGSASCMAAGMAAFTIGTETLGSILSPSHRCRVTGLRPTFGHVSRYGAMALSWTMDKVGPICRTAEDCALVLAAIHGADTRDLGTVDKPFRYRPDLDLRKLKIGYLEGDRTLDDDNAPGAPDDGLRLLRSLGADPKPVKFSQAADGIDTILSVEAAAAFEDITRDKRVDSISSTLWPAIFRNHQFTTGVGYLQAMRARHLLMRKFEEEFGEFDVIVTGDRGSFLLFITNMTGHPQLYIPFGLDKANAGRGISLIGRLYDEGTILGVGARIQQATDFWKRRPDLTKL